MPFYAQRRAVHACGQTHRAQHRSVECGVPGLSRLDAFALRCGQRLPSLHEGAPQCRRWPRSQPNGGGRPSRHTVRVDLGCCGLRLLPWQVQVRGEHLTLWSCLVVTVARVPVLPSCRYALAKQHGVQPAVRMLADALRRQVNQSLADVSPGKAGGAGGAADAAVAVADEAAAAVQAAAARVAARARIMGATGTGAGIANTDSRDRAGDVLFAATVTATKERDKEAAAAARAEQRRQQRAGQEIVALTMNVMGRKMRVRGPRVYSTEYIPASELRKVYRK